MKILHVIPGIDDPTCGIAVAALAIARRQQSGGNKVECVADREWAHVPLENVDEIWVHSMWLPSVVCMCLRVLRLKARGVNVRLVRMPHGCMDPVKMRHHLYKKMWVMPLEKWLFRHCDVVVSTAECENRWIADFARTGVGVVYEELGRGNDISLGPAHRRNGPLKLLYVGRLHVLKGVEYLIHAMEHEHLTIIGRNCGEEAKLRRLAEGREVVFAGLVAEEVKQRAYDECDVLVLPTLSENYGLVVAEALEHGMRVVTTDGAPAWEPEDGNDSAYDGRLLYLRGFIGGSDSERVSLLRNALKRMDVP